MANRPRVLVVDDKVEMAETVAEGLSDRGYEAMACDTSRRAVSRLEQERFAALVTDLRMPGPDGLELLAISRRLDPTRPVILMTAFAAIDSAVEAVRRGAYHYLTKPFRLDELALFLHRSLDEVRIRAEASALKQTLREHLSRDNIVARSAPMRGVFAVVDRVAATDAPVLLTGETGTGKGLLAHTLHAESRRGSERFVTVNCAALPEALLESELFGHVKGAFTGAASNKLGLFAEADGGTLFLDEIGEVAPSLQAKLLDVIERRVVRAVGATRERPVDVRVLAATNRDLRERVRSGAFREDLFYRLEVITLQLPALRDRRDDIPVLADRFLAEMRRRHPSSPVRRLSRGAVARLLDHSWPGNVRELSHALERIVLLGTAVEVSADDVRLAVREFSADRSRVTPSPEPSSPSSAAGQPFVVEGDVVPVRDVQRRYAAWALKQMGNNRTRTAERLSIDMKTLAKWLGEEQDG